MRTQAQLVWIFSIHRAAKKLCRAQRRERNLKRPRLYGKTLRLPLRC
jgi:hypothetical protein